MHFKTSLSASLVVASLFVAAPSFAQHDEHHGNTAKTEAPAKTGQLSPVTNKDAGWAAKERGSYPLDVCVTSDEKLGTMGKAPEYIYRVNGEPDRLVVFCCAGCDEDFLKAPAKYLAKIEAAKRKGKTDAGRAEHRANP
jgi:hypothetical protein